MTGPFMNMFVANPLCCAEHSGGVEPMNEVQYSPMKRKTRWQWFLILQFLCKHSHSDTFGNSRFHKKKALNFSKRPFIRIATFSRWIVARVAVKLFPNLPSGRKKTLHSRRF